LSDTRRSRSIGLCKREVPNQNERAKSPNLHLQMGDHLQNDSTVVMKDRGEVGIKVK